MEKILLTLIKILTLLTCLGMLFLTVYSLVMGLPLFLTFICAVFVGVTGYFSYQDIKQYLA